MKLHTRIFIGMAAGVAVGLLFGPNSLLATPDTIEQVDGAQLPLRLAPDARAGRVPLPPGLPVSLRQVAELPAPGGPWLRLAFEPSAQQVLVAPTLAPAGQVRYLYLARHDVPRMVWGPGLTLVSLLTPVGDLFMRLIKLLIVPLVFCSLLVGVASLGDVRKLGRIGGKTLGFFMLTTVLAISIGLIASAIVRPGRFVSAADRQALAASYGTSAAALVSGASDADPSATLVEIVPTNALAALAAERPNMLQVIFVALLAGVACTLVPRRYTSQVLSLLDKINDAMIMMIHITMQVAPLGVFALVAKVVGTSGLSVLGALVVYSLVVITGLCAHAIFVYTAAVRYLAKLPARGFWRVIRPAQLIAFSTSSSAAALPVALDIARDKLRVPGHTASFVLPLGTTINMDGTALYQGVAALFIAQVFGIELSFVDQLTIVLTATLASIGAAAVPGVGMITLAMVLTAVGVPTVGVALILGVDRLLDMFRSAVNVTGNLAATALIAASEGEAPSLEAPSEVR